MPKKIYVGIENIGNRKIKKLYFGSSQSLAKGVKKAYIGDANGIARCVFVSCEHNNISWWYNDSDVNYPTHRKVCNDCGDILVRSENCIPSSSWEYDGFQHFNLCTRCGAGVNIEEHTLQSRSNDPTCTEAGSSYTECSVCGYTTEYSEIPPMGHNYDYLTNADGTHVAECMRNGCDYIEENQRCTYDSESICIYCGYPCPHSWDYQSNGNGTHTSECMWCGQIRQETCDYSERQGFYVCSCCRHSCYHDWIRGDYVSEPEYLGDCNYVVDISCKCSICGAESVERMITTIHKEDTAEPGVCEICGTPVEEW